MKKIILTLLLMAVSIGFTQVMATYCASPPFVGGKSVVVKPNVLIVQDMTGSMTFWTYGSGSWTHTLYSYNPATTYYGYATSTVMYKVVTDGGFSWYQQDAAGTYSGNKINWWTMTRIDIARKVLTGGKGVAYNDKSKLYFQTMWYKVDSTSGTQIKGIKTTTAAEKPKGVIRTVADEDTNYIWDSDAPHFALMTFSTDPTFNRKIKAYFTDSLKVLLTQLETYTPSGATWVGDAAFEAIHYIRYCTPHWTGDYTWASNMIGTPNDPWYELVSGDTVSVSCRPTFVIMCTDGESNSDNKVATDGHLPYTSSPYGSSYNSLWKYNGPDNSDGSDGYGCADDYAYYAHIRDLRPDNDSTYGLPENQTITWFSIYLFGTETFGINLCKNIAKYGGFIDMNANLKPDLAGEYDANNDGKPDNYYQASAGSEIENAFSEIFIKIESIARVTSASAAAIVSPGMKTGGFATQAQFWPRLAQNPPDSDLTWIGNVQTLWLDPYGWLREDTDNNAYLHLKDDRVVMVYFDNVQNKTVAAIYEDTAGTGIQDKLKYIRTTAADSLTYVWHAGSWLLNASYDNSSSGRVIYTNKGGGRIGSITNLWVPADTVCYRMLGIKPWNKSVADSLIYWVRGLNYPNKRPRIKAGTSGKVWKLGDIIYSSPRVVGAPTERYDLIYGDSTYYQFWNQYKDRRRFIVCGANDGMIHVFNAGRYVPQKGSDPFLIGYADAMGKTLGQELYAIIPKNALPHLKWLWDWNYCHVYYNDLRTYATDLQLFTPDAVHPNGWGTIVIVGMRLGCGKIFVPPGDTANAAYTLLDVTDPNATTPNIMYEFSFPDIGYTVSMPSVIKVQNKWYIILGTGPQTLYGESHKRAVIYLVKLGVDRTAHTVKFDTLPAPESTTVITDLFGVDLGLNYSVNLIYFASYDSKTGDSKIWRINTHEDTNYTTWTKKQVIKLPNTPITSEGTATVDENGQLWIYYGTGKYWSNLDVADTTHQMVVGIKDDTTKGTLTTPAFTVDSLLNVTNVQIWENDSCSPYVTFDSLLQEIALKKGWRRYFDSLPGERMVNGPLVMGGTLIFTSFYPEDTMGAIGAPDLCLGGGGGPQHGFMWALYYMTGTAYVEPILGMVPPAVTHVAVIGDMPSEPSLYIGQSTEKVFIQTAGGLVSFETPLVYDPRKNIMLWRGR